ncbi:lysyl-tRNA synthetase [Friedmanniomyces endolithicus]|nr:lysyl-tRNA synthetase [Friedmanniomyces endolithicus]
MSEEPRRSGRATKGHAKASSSPAPNPQKSTKAKKSKSRESQEGDAEEEDDSPIRCICGEDVPGDKRPFIGCEACMAWQHNICMGMPVDEEDIPDHYLCELCEPKEHSETLAALEKGEEIWKVRTAKWKGWKKMSANRRKSRGKGIDDARPPWLKRDVGVEEHEETNDVSAEPEEETGAKRKRASVKTEPKSDAAPPSVESTVVVARPDKRRKSSQAPGKAAKDAETAIVDIDQLPPDRSKGAHALSKVIVEDLQERVKSGFRIPEGHTAKTLGDHYASLIEYALFMNHGKPSEGGYVDQYRTLYQNLKRNKVLIERLLEDSLRADELATMDSSAMASEEQQLEWKLMKEQEDRKTVVMPDEGPRYRSSHKGLEKIEDERMDDFAGIAQPVRERTSNAEDGTGSPTMGDMAAPASPLQGDIDPPGSALASRPSATPGIDRRTSSQHQFDMNSIWQKTSSAQSPTTATGPRPMQMQPRRRSSAMHVQAQSQAEGAKDDPDVDRLLQDDDDSYEPHGYTSDETVVWRGKVVHTGEGEPLVNARFVAGRDMASSAAWRDVLPPKLSVDGRLAIQKAEEYLCGLQWSQNSDVSVLVLTAVDDMVAFNSVFEYFHSRGRYAVVNKDKPALIKDLYIIPVEKGNPLPDHINMLEHNMLKTPAEERMLLATFVVARALGMPQTDSAAGGSPTQQYQAGSNTVGNTNGGGQQPQQQQRLPPHLRTGAPGPAGSPLTASGATFSPAQSTNAPPPPMSGYGVGIPPSPYEQQQQQATYPAAPHANSLVSRILGPRQWDPTALQVMAAQPEISESQLTNLRNILEEDVEARTNVEALARKLGM